MSGTSENILMDAKKAARLMGRAVRLGIRHSTTYTDELGKAEAATPAVRIRHAMRHAREILNALGEDVKRQQQLLALGSAIMERENRVGIAFALPRSHVERKTDGVTIFTINAAIVPDLTRFKPAPPTESNPAPHVPQPTTRGAVMLQDLISLVNAYSRQIYG